MAIKMLAPSEIWADYNPMEQPLNINKLDKRGNLEHFTFDAAIGGSPAPIYARINKSKEGLACLLIVGSFYNPTDESLIDSLVSEGYNVIEVDYTGIFQDSATCYPPEFAYGNIAQAGEHLEKITESAFDTSLYLYAKVFRRAITFCQEIFGCAPLILMGIKEGADIAITVAGLDKRINGLICLNGAAYSEYLSFNYHDPPVNLEKDEERMAYLMGVSSSAYTKLISCPTIAALGSNSKGVDMDRLANFLSLLPDKIQRVFTITPRAQDYIDNLSYNVIRSSLRNILNQEPLPSNPTIAEKLQEEALYFYITERAGLKVKSVGIYIAFDEHNRRYRNFEYKSCEHAGVGEYIAAVDIADAKEDVLVFGEVVYEGDIRLATLPVYVKVEGLFKGASPQKRLLYSAADPEHTFAAQTELPVLFGEGIKANKNKLGLIELSSATNDLITYEIGKTAYIKEGTLLQIELKTAGDNFIELILGEVKAGQLQEYRLELEVAATGDTFEAYMIEANDCKDKKFIGLEDFSMVKYIRLKGEGPFAIGNIILI